MTRAFLALILASFFAFSTPVIAQEAPSAETEEAEKSQLRIRSEQVVALLNSEIEPEGIFTDGFLAAVPISQLAAISQQLTTQFGAAIAVEGLYPINETRAGLHIRLERAIAKGGIAIDPADDNRISELLFQEFEPVDDSPEKIEADLRALPGEVSALFAPVGGGPPLISVDPEKQMALGSTFKLYVLAALAQDVRKGGRSWNDVVALDTKSFPSGMMQDWPDGAPVTLHTLASLMISISDNTATDQLIKLVGKGRLDEILDASGHSAADLNEPFLTTRELFLLKGGDRARLSAYSAADAEVRAQILGGLEDNPPGAGQVARAFLSGPVAIDVEWFGSAKDLENLFQYMGSYADDTTYDILAINPSVPPPIRARWDYIGYKGGSEPGVLNLTWLLVDPKGKGHVLTLSWSNPEANIEQTTLELIAQRILSLPRD
ncbi:serine hydrolase [uncultured Erythrobacter sp.]|uniref:serine hydrolase n=1 Tax=uncultured Erythrobacter sp. TaxID=263913 RepID=UPI00260943AB|nr:serine hydrolase [uncultured Erythrobacter sp.]